MTLIRTSLNVAIDEMIKAVLSRHGREETLAFFAAATARSRRGAEIHVNPINYSARKYLHA
jgi:hypothetical protein